MGFLRNLLGKKQAATPSSEQPSRAAASPVSATKITEESVQPSAESDRQQAEQTVKKKYTYEELMALGSINEFIQLVEETGNEYFYTISDKLQGRCVNNPWVMPNGEDHERLTNALLSVIKEKSASMNKALLILNIIQSEVAVEPLIALLPECNPSQRKDILYTLGEIKSPRMLEPLLKMLSDPDEEFRKQVIDAIVTLKDPRAIRPLAKLLEEGNIETKAVAIKALGENRGPGTIEVILPYLKSEYLSLRNEAMKALGNLKAKETLPEMISALASEEHGTRMASIAALGSLTDIGGVEPLLKLTKDPDENIRRAVMRALGDIGVYNKTDEKFPKIIDALKKGSRDKHMFVSQMARESLFLVK